MTKKSGKFFNDWLMLTKFLRVDQILFKKYALIWSQ